MKTKSSPYFRSGLLPSHDHVLKSAVLRLLAIKECDIRLLDLEQCKHSVDKGLHSGGAFSALIPMVALFYGGFASLNVADPTAPGQDMFTLSKGHAVATLASIYAELGYFDRSILRDSRSYDSILNGHPGPVLPGVHIATGPMGQGFSVAQGLAIIGKTSPRFDSYCMVGDGELQEGSIWEAVMYAGTKHLDNFCLFVDQNNGQLDISMRTIFPMPNLEAVFQSFGWQAFTIDATQFDGVYTALENFRYGPRNGKPTAIICKSTKGQGAFSDFLNKHKVTMSDALVDQEVASQQHLRKQRVEDLRGLLERDGSEEIAQEVFELAARMHLSPASGFLGELPSVEGPVLTKRAPVRAKAIAYDAAQLPKIEKGKDYAASDIVTGAMKIFARDPRVASVDSDLASISGLEAGIGHVDQGRALNVGVAEANMMCLGESFALMGFNTWVSTFCPFFDWKVLRRIAVGWQERQEAIESNDGWLSEGHNLDLTFLATGPNLETRTNGATHMGNDDITIFDGVAHLRIIDVSCPVQLLSVMKWIMSGNRGLVYCRILRAAATALYDQNFVFEFGKGYSLRSGQTNSVVIVSSGRGVYEALKASDEAAKLGISVGVVDMPSIDPELLLSLYKSSMLICFAEQNNGYIWQNFLKVMVRSREICDGTKVLALNTLDARGKAQYLHSGTYEELLDAVHLAPGDLVGAITERLKTLS
jgi:transketolase